MAKKKKKVQKAAKKEHKKKTSLIPLLIIAVVFLALVAVLVFKTSIIFKKYTFDEALVQIGMIDSKANFSFSDFDNGFEYIRENPPRDPLNSGEVDPVIKAYSKISGSKQTNLLVDFRKNFLLSYKYYIYSQKTYKADIKKYAISCKNLVYVNESIVNQRLAVQYMNDAVKYLEELKTDFSEDFNKLNINDKTFLAYKAIPIDIDGESTYKIETFNEICANKTGAIQ